MDIRDKALKILNKELKSLTQIELAKYIGVQRPTLNKWINKHHKMSSLWAEKILRKFK